MRKKLIVCMLCFILVLGVCSCSLFSSCEHRDADDDGKCDLCAEEYTDGCEGHADVDDDEKCDSCGIAYADGCNGHRDADDDYKCDKCDAAYSDGIDNPLHGKKIIFIGNSYTYYGQTVLEKSQSRLTQEVRSNDKGYFYQLCRANGIEVSVTNWTFGGHGLMSLFGGNCTADRGCDGEDHKAYLTDRSFDYVVIQPGSGIVSSVSFLSSMEVVTSFFREANPDVKFVVLVPYSAYGQIGGAPYLAKEMLDALKTVAEAGVTVVDWGGVVMNILNGVTEVPGSALEYVKNTFVISKSEKDGYHPNQLSGYITTLMTYCAITGEDAVGQTYDFCNDPSLRSSNASSKFFNFDNFIATYYTYDGATTNYPDVFASETDMLGIQMLIDAHLADKAYMTYNYTAP